MQSNASHVVISRNNVLSLCEQMESMSKMAGSMRHHQTTAPTVAFASHKPPLVATIPQSTMQREQQMASEQYIRHRHELNRQAGSFSAPSWPQGLNPIASSLRVPRRP